MDQKNNNYHFSLSMYKSEGCELTSEVFDNKEEFIEKLSSLIREVTDGLYIDVDIEVC